LDVAQALVQKWWLSVGPDPSAALDGASGNGAGRLEVWR
jgi:hypothetical protein